MSQIKPMKIHLFLIMVIVLFSGCVVPEQKFATEVQVTPEITLHPIKSPVPAIEPAEIVTQINTPAPPDVESPADVNISPKPAASKTNEKTATIEKTSTIEKTTRKAYENASIAVEVNYRNYVDWFLNHNLNIRSYTPQEYVCGQYTVDMINDSGKAGYHAYFAAVRFTDGTGHAIVSFKSTFSGFTSWYFFEPQTNNLITPETFKEVLNNDLNKIVSEVTVYGYFDDAGDNDPTTWRFAYPLYNKKY